MEIRVTQEFKDWLRSLAEPTRAVITMRLLHAERGTLGDHKSLGAGLWELRIHTGPGYRVYYAQRGTTLVIILAGGTKRHPQRDIARARNLLITEAWHGTDPL